MYKASNVMVAESLAEENGLLSGFSVMNGQWYVGTSDELNAIGVLHNNLCFQATTRGKKYTITVKRGWNGRYVAEFFTSGKSTATATGYTRKEMQKRIVDEIMNSKRYDNINYKISIDDLDVGKLLNIIFETGE